MVKKIEEDGEELLVSGDQSSVISGQLSVNDDSALSLIPLPAAEGKEYEETSWGGKPLFVCSFCKFDTFDESAMLEHLYNKHGSENALKTYFEDEKE